MKGIQNFLDAVRFCDAVHLLVLTSSVASIFGDNAYVLEMKNKSSSSSSFNMTSSFKYTAYPYSRPVAEKEAWKWTSGRLEPNVAYAEFRNRFQY